MKKLTVLLLLAATFTASAATIQWGTNSNVARLLKTSDGGTGSSNRVASGSLVCLVYMGSGTTFSFDNTLSSYSESANGVSGGTIVATGKLTSNGSYTSTYSKTPYTEMNGNYGLLFFDATSWETISSGTSYGVTTSLSPVALTSEVDATQNALLTENVAFTGTIAAVPEPATGALALAGIALLFKRRKARA